ncbi:MAG: type VI secretion system tip protein VgrG [Desulfotalea sp.]
MVEKSQPKFVFESDGIDKDTFHVVNFKGNEGLSTLYRFRFLLISPKEDLDIAELLHNTAKFTIQRDGGKVSFKGVLCSFEQMHQAGSMFFYRAELVPQMWRASLSHNNRIYLNKDIKDVITDALTAAGFKLGLNFEFRLNSNYPVKEYVCQYNESYFDFISGWMERLGIYYYFEQSESGEKMIITDSSMAHLAIPEASKLRYSPSSGLDVGKENEFINDFILKQQPMPHKVMVKSYNYHKPSLDLKAEAIVSPRGLGEMYVYGDNFLTLEDGEKLAKIRAEEYLCREKIYHATTTIPYIRSGYTFLLEEHYRKDFNQSYLVVDVTHEGSQEAYLVSGLGVHLASNEDRLYYRNSITTIPASVQFRAERKTAKVQLSGAISAKIDAAGSGKYAELDKEGRYKVIMPFDESGREGGRATAWLRMSQPYGGATHGMYFPLHKGTEVLITCVNGDPDQPIIQAVAPNPENPSLVNDSSQTMNKITTAGGNLLHMSDKEGDEGICLKTPHGHTTMRMGSAAVESESSDESEAPESSESEPEEKEESEFWLMTEGDIEIGGKNLGTMVKGNEFKMVLGSSEEVIVGNDTKAFLILKEDMVIGLETGLKMGGELGFAPLHTCIHGEAKHIKGELTELTASKELLSGQVTALAEITAHTNGQLVTLSGEHQDLKGDHDALVGTTNQLAGDVNRIDGDVDVIVGAHNYVAGEVSKVQGTVTQCIAEATRVAASVNETLAEHTRILGEMNDIAGQVSVVATETNTVTALAVIV